MRTFAENPTLLGFDLSTQLSRDHDDEADLLSFFPYEAEIAAISVFVCRTKVHSKEENVIFRWFCGFAMAALAYKRAPYNIIFAAEMFSYVISFVWLKYRSDQRRFKTNPKQQATSFTTLLSVAVGGAAVSWGLGDWIASGGFFEALARWTPSIIHDGFDAMFPITEFTAAYHVMASFVDPGVLKVQLQHLLFVTLHIQIGIGFMGIQFLTREQSRRNELIRLDVDESTNNADGGESTTIGNNNHTAGDNNDDSSSNKRVQRAARFRRGAVPFIFFTALPYMFQVILYGNVNMYAYKCVHDSMHRAVRLNQLFDNDTRMTALATETATSPESYATAMNSVVSTAYDIANRKLFSLPKILLLFPVFSRKPTLVIQVFPVIFFVDWIKATAVSYMTTEIEKLRKEAQEIRSVRSKVEAFDMKNAELLQVSGRSARQFTHRRWEQLTVRIQARQVVSDIVERTKRFFSFLQRNFVFVVLIDSALAGLIAVGKIQSVDVFVFSRAIEDAVDFMLTKSRSEAELARLMTEIGRLEELVDIWGRSSERRLLPCFLPNPEDHDKKSLIIRNLQYTRGTASVRADHVEFGPGVYALTGANGSGKSTLFRTLMSCDTNEKSIDLPISINLMTPLEPLKEEDDLLRDTACLVGEEKEGHETSSAAPDGGTEASHIPKLLIRMPSSDVVEISQTFYWPLYTKPIDWIYQEHMDRKHDEATMEKLVRDVAENLHSLKFTQAKETDEEEDNEDFIKAQERAIQGIMDDLVEEKEDWFGSLSGGQKSKVELVRKVFLQDTCPSVLLIDETMAPLDPTSKALVMSKLKLFCQDSVIIVIYHTDVGRGKDEGGEEIVCVPSNDFFDANIHLENGILHVKETC